MSADENSNDGSEPKRQSLAATSHIEQAMLGGAEKQQSVIAESRRQQSPPAPQRIRQSLIAESDEAFFDGIAKIVEASKAQIERAVNTVMCLTYYEVGRLIVEQEQAGERRAKYGIKLLEDLSSYLTARCGKGWSVRNLRNARQFYLLYSPEIRQSPTSESGTVMPLADHFNLSWTHYLILMRIADPDIRRFYEIEAQSQQWSVRQLQRQVGSSLYERLALSRDKDAVMRLAREGQTVEQPRDLLKNPLVLEFLDMEQAAAYSETELEKAIIANLQKFLLELGKGFLFEARQKRFGFDEQSFFVDLVFYNRLLQCYVLIDLKTGKLQHQDLGQMQMYVNYFDRYVKQDFENPTVGILLCKEKNDSIVELTLPADSNIYASEYSLYLPDKALLQRKLAEWIEEFESAHILDEGIDESEV